MGQCVLESSNNVDPLCRKYGNGACLECSQGSYMKKGVCMTIDTHCKKFNVAS